MEQKVRLNVYDLTNGMAKAMSKQFLGIQLEAIWHTGVVVYGIQYYFGGGICEDAPNCTPYGKPMKTIDIGTTEIPKQMFMQYLQDVNHKYSMSTYDIFENNCNNFSHDICQFLTGNGIPSQIIELPKKVLQTPLGQMMKPFIAQMQGNIQNKSHPHNFY